MLSRKAVNCQAVVATVHFGDREADAVADLHVERLAQGAKKAAQALNAIGLAAKVAIIFGVNPIFFVNASRVGFESAGTCSGDRAALLGIVFSANY
jgi:hypothetical protein